MARLTDLVRGNPLFAAAFFVFFAAYSNSLNSGFQRDDLPHIVDNAFIKDLSAARKLFSRDYFQLDGATAYRPAVTAARVVEYRLFGLNPWPWRFLNLLLHAANAALLCWLFLRLTGLPAAAAAGAALFLLHPVQTEALNYVSNGQCDIFCLFFLCFSFAAYLEGKTAASLAAFTLALLSKEMALAFPFVLAAFACFRGEFREKWKVPVYGAALALSFTLWRLLYFRAGPGFIDNVRAEGAYNFSVAGALSAAVKFPALLVYYLKLLLWPSVLSAEIDRILPEAGFFSGPGIAFSWLLIVGLAAWAAALYKKNGNYALLLSAFALLLLPVSGLVPLTSLLQEHFVYIPSAVFCLFAGLGYQRAAVNGSWRKAAIAALALALLGSAGRVRARNGDWKTPLALAESDVRSFPASATALSGLAAEKKAAGDSAVALELCLRAIAAGTGDGEAYFLAAEIYVERGLRDKAVAEARLGLEKYPGSPDSLVNAARIFARAGLGAEALALARGAAAGYPYFEPAFYTLGELLLDKDPLEAELMFREALRLNSRSRAAAKLERLHGGVPVIFNTITFSR